MFQNTDRLDWGMAELLAYGSLLSEGNEVRLTGQDVRRGTFSHRHAAIYNAEDGVGHIPLVDVARDSSTRMDIYDSFLSEEAVLGFEYGYSLAEPNALIGFAGPRVIEQTINQTLPEGFQRAEFLEEKGFVDKVVHRNDMKTTLSKLLALHRRA